jgi:hypothetical protein
MSYAPTMVFRTHLCWCCNMPSAVFCYSPKNRWFSVFWLFKQWWVYTPLRGFLSFAHAQFFAPGIVYYTWQMLNKFVLSKWMYSFICVFKFLKCKMSLSLYIFMLGFRAQPFPRLLYQFVLIQYKINLYCITSSAVCEFPFPPSPGNFRILWFGAPTPLYINLHLIVI